MYYNRKGTFKFSTEHVIVVCAWDIIGEGFCLECSCGFCTEVTPLMEVVGAEFDDHNRMMGILND